MTVVTLRPNGTTYNSGALTGGATAHAVLSDDSDSSYVRFSSGQSALVSLGDLSLPAGAVIKQLVGSGRSRKAAASTAYGYGIYAPSGTLRQSGGLEVTWATFTTVAAGPVVPSSYGAITDSDVDDAQLGIVGQGAGTDVDISELYLAVTYVAKPVTDVTAPTGTVTNSNTPPVTWANTLDTDGGAQSKYEVKIFSAAQYGAGGFNPSSSTPTETSGIVASSGTTWSPSDPLPDATYRAYVRVAQSVLGSDHWSDWDYLGFTIAASAPGIPTIKAVAEDAEARIWITLDDTLGAGATHAFEVQRSVDAGASWETIRTLDGGLITPTSGVGRAYDTEVGNGQTVRYRARALNISTFTTYSAWSSSTTPTAWQSSSWWLKSPTEPDLNIPVEMAGMDPLEQGANQGIFQALGRRLPIVVSDVRGGFHGAVSFTFDDQAERDEFDELLDTLEPLLLQAPPANHWEDRYVMLGDLSRARGVDKAFVEWTVEKLGWTEVDAPTGDVLAWPAFGS